VAEIVELYERWGDDPYDEAIGQREHALQTAALAVAEQAQDALVAAALLHDVGHLLDLTRGCLPDGDDLHHEDTGAAWLRPLFPAAVTAPIALHVRAKRFLVAAESTYGDRLSPGSIRSLAAQGGPLSAAEMSRFRSSRGADDAVRLRRWDDAAKVDGLQVAPFTSYTELLHRLTCP
jgi:predicted HD phosphohydrolase